MKIKTFTISVDELTDILSITDPSVRDAAISAIRSAASDPDSISDNPEGEAAPVLLRIRRKAISRSREKARRQKRAEAKKVQDKVQDDQAQPTQNPTNAQSPRVPYTEEIARKLLYLKSNMNQTFDYTIDIIKIFTFGDSRFTAGTELIERIFDRIRIDFAPMFDFATIYMNMPPAEREGITAVPEDAVPAQPVG